MSTPSPVELEGHAALRAAAVALIGSAERELRIASHCLESRLYRHRELIEAMKTAMRLRRRLQVRILISEPTTALRQSEPLLEVWRRLSSQVSLYTPATREAAFEQECLIADESVCLLRERPDHLFAREWREDPLAVRAQLRKFDQAWEQSRPASELRRLGL